MLWIHLGLLKSSSNDFYNICCTMAFTRQRSFMQSGMLRRILRSNTRLRTTSTTSPDLPISSALSLSISLHRDRFHIPPVVDHPFDSSCPAQSHENAGTSNLPFACTSDRVSHCKAEHPKYTSAWVQCTMISCQWIQIFDPLRF